MNDTILHKPHTVVNLREVQSTREHPGASIKGQYEALNAKVGSKLFPSFTENPCRD
jgi:hypothetical protein